MERRYIYRDRRGRFCKPENADMSKSYEAYIYRDERGRFKKIVKLKVEVEIPKISILREERGLNYKYYGGLRVCYISKKSPRKNRTGTITFTLVTSEKLTEFELMNKIIENAKGKDTWIDRIAINEKYFLNLSITTTDESEYVDVDFEDTGGWTKVGRWK